MTSKSLITESTQSESIFAKPYVDLVFKRVFGRKENTNVLKRFLADLLGRIVVDVRLENNELPPHDDLDGKSVRFDVLVTVLDPDGEHIINLEIQNVSHPSIPKRAMYCGSRLYLNQLKKGDSYELLVPTVVIFILNFEYFADEGPAHAVRSFCIAQRGTGQELMPEANPLVLTFLELPKHAKSENIPIDRMTPLQRWLTFLCARSDKELEELRMVGPEFDEAISDIEYAKLSDAEKRYYIARMDYLRDQHAIMTENVEYASREARAKALIEGRDEGRQEGLALGAEAQRKLILKVARKKFAPVTGPASAPAKEPDHPQAQVPASLVQALQKLETKILNMGAGELEGMVDRLLDAQTIDEVLL